MTALKREATIRWLGHPPDSAPRLSVGSHSIAPLLSLQRGSRGATDPLATLPGELLAGAIGSVFTWLVAEQLVQEGTQARELVSYVTLTLSGEADDAHGRGAERDYLPDVGTRSGRAGDTSGGGGASGDDPVHARGWACAPRGSVSRSRLRSRGVSQRFQLADTDLTHVTILLAMRHRQAAERWSAVRYAHSPDARKTNGGKVEK